MGGINLTAMRIWVLGKQGPQGLDAAMVRWQWLHASPGSSAHRQPSAQGPKHDGQYNTNSLPSPNLPPNAVTVPPPRVGGGGSHEMTVPGGECTTKLYHSITV